MGRAEKTEREAQQPKDESAESRPPFTMKCKHAAQDQVSGADADRERFGSRCVLLVFVATNREDHVLRTGQDDEAKKSGERKEKRNERHTDERREHRTGNDARERWPDDDAESEV